MCTMILFASLFALSLPIFAVRLDLVILPFPEVKSIEEVNAALARVRLDEINSSFRGLAQTNEPSFAAFSSGNCTNAFSKFTQKARDARGRVSFKH